MIIEPIKIENGGRTYLVEVVIMRLALIVLLITTHVFAPFSGGEWSPLEGYGDMSHYQYISSIAHFISMPALIFLSGYLLGHTEVKGTSNFGFSFLLRKKFTRLIIPSIIFSAIYFVFFLPFDSNKLPNILYSIFNGCGHMWFLPMLFWCFIFSFLLSKTCMKPKWILMVSLVMAVMPLPSLPLRLASFCTYFIYFEIGKMLYYRMLRGGVKLRVNWWLITATVSVYLTLIIIWTHRGYSGQFGLIGKALYIIGANTLHCTLGIIGTFIAFVLTYYILMRRNIVLPTIAITLSGYCYGVYICHQFVIKWIFYQTQLPQSINHNFFPWIACVICILLSVLLTSLLLKSKIGRFLIA